MKKNGALQIMRLVFSLVIVQYHFRSFEQGPSLPTGYLATDFFFIISGYFMMAHAQRKTNGRGVAIWCDTWQYLSHKFGKLVPYYLASFAVAFCARVVFCELSFRDSILMLWSSLTEVFLIGGAGIHETYINGATWYESNSICRLVLDQEVPFTDGFPNQLIAVS